MHFQKSDIEKYLQGVWDAIEAGKYQISPRPKNRELLTDYIISERKELYHFILSSTKYQTSIYLLFLSTNKSIHYHIILNRYRNLRRKIKWQKEGERFV